MSADDRGTASGMEVVREITSILQRVGIPAWIIDEQGVFTWVNDAFVARLGDRRGEHYSVVVAPEYRELVDHQFARKLAGDPHTDYEIEVLLPNGRRTRAEVSSVRLEDAGLCCAVFGMSATNGTSRPARPSHLTPRQHEVLVLLASGASTDQIARELHVTKQTVRNYVRQILQALHVHSRLEAVVKARREGLVFD